MLPLKKSGQFEGKGGHITGSGTLADNGSGQLQVLFSAFTPILNSENGADFLGA